jgi:hypothetical protein
MRQVHVHHFIGSYNEAKQSKAIKVLCDKALLGNSFLATLLQRHIYRRVTEALTGLMSYISLDDNLIDFIDYFV